MTKLTRIEVNCATGEEKIVELTAAEIAELDQMKAQAEELEAQREAETQAKAEAKASALAKLAELGLTEDEAKAIAG
jgi:Mg2+/Co2+ transporter CorB